MNVQSHLDFLSTPHPMEIILRHSTPFATYTIFLSIRLLIHYPSTSCSFQHTSNQIQSTLICRAYARHCQQLEPFFPDIRHNRKSILVSRTMMGCMRRFGTPVKQKTPLSHANLLVFILDSMVLSPSHDDLLFAALILTGFHALMRLGELVFPDEKALRNYRKISLWHSVSILPSQYSFFLPSHKGDHFFEGNIILIQKLATSTDPYNPFIKYLTSRDTHFPIHPELWLTSTGSVPTSSVVQS